MQFCLTTIIPMYLNFTISKDLLAPKINFNF